MFVNLKHAAYRHKGQMSRKRLVVYVHVLNLIQIHVGTDSSHFPLLLPLVFKVKLNHCTYIAPIETSGDVNAP